MNSKKDKHSVRSHQQVLTCETFCPAATRTCGRAHPFVCRSKPFNPQNGQTPHCKHRFTSHGFLL
ncbi:hypothetical protein HanHA300_Chr13g0475031 [Helianthus annuus]|nr:hypothetical protein HanHA300_Chr13g0475031 [Helianthus annuus]KAJ0497043.1 hypothetical protein HanHA89_Chr13g0506951 [Helianthus annuus]